MSSSIRSGKIPYPLEQFEVVGRGENYRPLDNAIVVDAGWNTDSTLSCAVLMKVSSKLKSVRIIAEFRAYVQTRWEGLSTLATQRESPAHKVSLSGRVFQQMVQVVYDSKDPISPNANGNPLHYPFRFVLPRNNLPPTYDAIEGAIQYYVKVSILFQEPMKLLKTSYEMEVPVIIGMPESAKVKLLTSPSQLIHPIEGSDTKLGCTIHFPKRIVQLGETIDVNIAITSTPGDTRLRSMNVSMRPVFAYLSNQQHLTQARGAHGPVTRPLCEITESFPLIKIGGDGGMEPIMRNIPLFVDPEIAMPSFESPLISVKTIFRLQITLDDSETPNVAWEVPIVVLAPIKGSLPSSVSTRHLQRSRSQGNVAGIAGGNILRGPRDSRQMSSGTQRQKRSDSLSARRFNGAQPPTPVLANGGGSSIVTPSTASFSGSNASPSTSFLGTPSTELYPQKFQHQHAAYYSVDHFAVGSSPQPSYQFPPNPQQFQQPQYHNASTHTNHHHSYAAPSQKQQQQHQYSPIVQRSQTVSSPRLNRTEASGIGLGFVQAYDANEDPINAALGGFGGVNVGYEEYPVRRLATREQQAQRTTTEKKFHKRQELDGFMAEMQDMQSAVQGVRLSGE
ncbi:UNVERIFIED_CONTAM: hypothetical protein HDU68_000974 [Siphonaria sp. JEL0065]|nr:hypothetical protein HDU68_000974 [Siphonaria sp. JEL0065]